MSKVITFSRYFPSYHPRAGQETLFVEKIWASLLHHCDYNFHLDFPDLEEELKNYWEKVAIVPKHHTIRAGHRFSSGDWFSPRVWSGKPYNSKQIIIAPDIEVKKTWDLSIVDLGGVHCIRLNNEPYGQFHPLAKGTQDIAKNDGLTAIELIQWFSNPSPFGKYQIICWNENINY